MPWLATQIEWDDKKLSPVEYHYIGDKKQSCINEVIRQILHEMRGVNDFEAVNYDLVDFPSVRWLKEKLAKAEKYRALLLVIENAERHAVESSSQITEALA